MASSRSNKVAPLDSVSQRGSGQRHHHIDPGFIGGLSETTHHPGGEGGPIRRHAAGTGHLGAEVEERTSPEHRDQHAVTAGVHHHEVERAAPEIEHGNTDRRHGVTLSRACDLYETALATQRVMGPRRSCVHPTRLTCLAWSPGHVAGDDIGA